MKAIQLHDKYTEDVIGTVLLHNGVEYDKVTEAWDKYQDTHNSNTELRPDIYEFELLNYELCEVLDLDFYQPC